MDILSITMLFFFDEAGNWTVVQHETNSDIKMARRYHWISKNVVSSFVSEPHSGIICNKAHRSVLDMTASESIEAQKTSLDLIRGNPQNLVSSIKKLNLGRNSTLDDWISNNEEISSKIKLTDSF